MKILFPIIIILFSITWWFIGSYYSQNLENDKYNKTESLENNITNIVKEVSPSIVSIIVKKDLTLYRRDPWWFFRTPVWSIEQKVWWWTWFFITKDWVIITNKHVVTDSNSKYIVITNTWEEYESKIIYLDNETDLALLKIDYNSNPLDFISSENNINIWNFAIAIWNALAEFQNSVSLGIISWKNRDLWEDWLKNMIQTDASINPWNSWGPLLNTYGKVIWINTLIINNSEWLWFAIPLDRQKINNIIENIN